MSSSINIAFATATNKPPLQRPTTADLLREPPRFQRRADPKARLKYGCLVARNCPRNESQSISPGFDKNQTSAKRINSVAISDDDGPKSQTSRSKTGLPKYLAGCEAVKAKLSVIMANFQKLLQQCADMFGELSVRYELDIGLQDSLQDVVRLVSEDSVAGRATVDIVQNAVDVQSAWLSLMVTSGYASVDVGHIRQIDRIVSEEDQLIIAQKAWIQTMKNATDLSSHVPLPRDPDQRWRWLQMHVKFGTLGKLKDSIRKRMEQIFFFRVKNIRRLKALKLAAASLNFQCGGKYNEL